MKIIKDSKGICDSTTHGARPGDMLEIQYTGRFDNENGKIFDSGPYKFQLGAGQVSITFFIFQKQFH